MPSDRASLPRQCDATRLLGSHWRDEHGNEYRIFSISYGAAADPKVRLAYVPPDRKALTLSQIESTHTLVKEGYPRAGT